MINQNISLLKQSSTLLINEKVKELRIKGKEISHFGFGQSPFPIHASIVAALRENAENNHYLPVAGLEELREEIVLFLKKHQNIKTTKESIFIGPGSKELLYQSILIFDADFLIPKGSWVSYIPQIQSKGGTYHILDTNFENDFKLTPQNLDTFFKNKRPKKQTVLILNSPNNPTGAIYSKEEYKALAMACRKHSIVVFSDEIYSQINFSQGYSPSISAYYPEKTIVFGGLSKVFSAGGYRLGYMMLPNEMQVLQKVYKSLFSETFSCVSSPIQFAAIKAFEYHTNLQNYVATSSAILKSISEFIFNELSAIKIECTKSEGAFYMLIGFNRYKAAILELGISGSFELANYVLENYDFAMLPGVDFGFEKEELFFRIAFVDFNGEDVMRAYESHKNIDSTFIEENAPNIFLGVEKIKTFMADLK
ncbi:MAG: aspartate/methionine/tyrosine aminotransferase [Paraglaciecola sp.]|jgi:aspartate/methionine/tyrosine aminotransferase|uniref:pyridoxal phosphate-dependent aminotransferase n=1 Tax=Polaribacter sp. TaxID=1920175 RepID=UPI003ACE4256